MTLVDITNTIYIDDEFNKLENYNNQLEQSEEYDYYEYNEPNNTEVLEEENNNTHEYTTAENEILEEINNQDIINNQREYTREEFLRLRDLTLDVDDEVSEEDNIIFNQETPWFIIVNGEEYFIPSENKEN